MPLDIGSHDPIRIPITDGAAFAAGLRDAGEHAARMGPVMLVANTPDFDAGHSALDRVRMTVSGLDVQVRMVTDGHVWMDVDHNSAGPVTPEHRREVMRLFPPPARSVTPAELADRFAPRGTDLTPALTAGEATWETDVLGTREALVAERDWITATVHQATTTGTPLSDHDAARLLLNIHNSELRDHAVTGMHTHNAAAHTHLWADLTARAPEAYRDSPTALTALSLWLDHRPAEAAIAADQVRDPRHVLADLVTMSVRLQLDPRRVPPSPESPMNWPPTPRDRPSGQASLPQRPAPQVTFSSSPSRDQHSPAR